MTSIQLDSFPHTQRLSVDESKSLGKAAREQAPRSAHADWSPAADRIDAAAQVRADELDLLQELVPVRHERMSVSAFTFYRGSAGIMAADLRATPTSGIHVQLCGDAHLSNFGVFASAERNVLFDVNDFDETLVGPWEWDVKRLAASFVLAARNQDFPAGRVAESAELAVRFYREAMGQFAQSSLLEVWYASLQADDLRAQLNDPKMVKQFDANLAKARKRTSMRQFDKLTEIVDGDRRIVSDAPLVMPLRDAPELVATHDLDALVHDQFSAYAETLSPDRRQLLARYRLADVALKVVGVGSVGTRCLIALLEGRDWDDPLLLQFKEAGIPALQESGGLPASPYKNQGQRVVEGQRLMQSSSDIFLGWTRGPKGRDFYWRQLADMKGSYDVDNAVPDGLALYARACGWTLARAHARSGNAVAIDAYLGKKATFDDAVTEFAERYADQAEADFAVFKASL